jgi:predicted RNA-binding protein YlxR (DUF448 family)
MRITIQKSDMCLVDTLRQLMGRPMYIKAACLALEGKGKN